MIYCNVSSCSNWEKLDNPVSPKKPPGFTPLFEVTYKGTCKSKVMKVKRSTVVSSSGVVQKNHICTSYNTQIEDGSGIVCVEDRCLYDNSSHECMKDDIYVDMKTIHEGTQRYEVPACQSFSDKKFQGHYDWRRLAEGGYGYTSSGPS